MGMAKKYDVYIQQKTTRSHILSDKLVIILNMAPSREVELFDYEDIIWFMQELGLEWKPFDFVFDGASLDVFVSNNTIDLSFHYCEVANDIFITAVFSDIDAKHHFEATVKTLQNMDVKPSSDK